MRTSPRRDRPGDPGPPGFHPRKEQTMCRWLAYSGSPVLIEEVLYKPKHSLIDQSLHSRLGAETTNGDGFGLGWYDPDAETPAVFHSIEPAWNDRNLREVASHVESPHPTSNRRSSSPTSAPPPARPSSRPTATLFVTASGCGCTTASSGTSIS